MFTKVLELVRSSPGLVPGYRLQVTLDLGRVPQGGAGNRRN